jgi:hypothetical protein
MLTYMCNACRKPVVPAEHVSVGGLIHHAACAAALMPKRSCDAKIGHLGDHQYIGGAALALPGMVFAGAGEVTLVSCPHIPDGTAYVFQGAAPKCQLCEDEATAARIAKRPDLVQWIAKVRRHERELMEQVASLKAAVPEEQKTEALRGFNAVIEARLEAGDSLASAVALANEYLDTLNETFFKCDEPMVVEIRPLSDEETAKLLADHINAHATLAPLVSAKADGHAVHLAAHEQLRGMKADRIIIDDGGQLEPRKGVDMATLVPVEGMTIEDFRRKYEREPRPSGDDVHCAVCNGKAPRKLGYDYTRFERDGAPSLIVCIDGWMKFFYPWNEKAFPATTTWPEHSNLCAKCGKRVAEYVALLKDPGVTEHDL